MDVSHGGIDKVASSWTLYGWSPPWTRAAVTLRGLKSPSTWTYDRTTYWNHGKNHHVVRLIFPSLSLYFPHICMLYYFRCSISSYARIESVGCILTSAKICLSFKKTKKCTF